MVFVLARKSTAHAAEFISTFDNMSKLLTAVGLKKSFGDLNVIKGIDLSMNEGEFIAITGPSGSGKSTLLHLLGGLEKPDSGSLHFRGKPYPSSSSDLDRFRNESLGFVFQFHHLMPEFTALENMCMPAWIAGKKDTDAKALSLAKDFGLGDRLQHLPSELSGGEQQRVAVVRALMQSPDLLLADEPSGNLDQALSMSLFQLLDQARQRFGTSIIVVTHSKAWSDMADRCLRMEDGQWVKVTTAS